MTATNYDAVLAFVLDQEGGYSNDRGDPGGPTNWGITIWDARMYWKHDATANDVRHMPLEVAKQIYRSKYWNWLSCDELPSGVDLAVMDYGVNSGVHRSAMVLQRLVGVPDDGIIGPHTLAAIITRKTNDVSLSVNTTYADLVTAICDERLHFLQSLHTWSTFGRGWGRRVAECKQTGLEMAAK